MESPYSIPDSSSNETLKLAEYIDQFQPRTLQKRQRFLEFYERSSGNISLACRAAGITRRTYYNWINADPHFKEALKFTLEIQREEAADILWYLAVIKKEGWAVRFWLTHNHPDYMKRKYVLEYLRPIKGGV